MRNDGENNLNFLIDNTKNSNDDRNLGIHVSIKAKSSSISGSSSKLKPRKKIKKNA